MVVAGDSVCGDDVDDGDGYKDDDEREYGFS